MRLRDLPEDVDDTLMALRLMGGHGKVAGDTLASDVAANIPELAGTREAVESALEFLCRVGELKINERTWWLCSPEESNFEEVRLTYAYASLTPPPQKRS